MNKKGFLGTIILIVVLVIIVAGVLFYFQIRSHGVQISSGNIVVDLKFNDSNLIGDAIDDFNGTIDFSDNAQNVTNSSINISN